MSEKHASSSWDGSVGKAVLGAGGAIILLVLGWAGFQLLKIDRIDINLTSQKDKLEEIDKQVKSMRLVFRDYMLDDKPDKKALIKRLVAQQPTPLYVGMENFIDGKYNAAFGQWIPAAQRGDQESKVVAESALVKLYRGPNGFDRTRHEVAAGVLTDLFRAQAYEPSDPKVVKFKMMLDEVKPPTAPQSPIPYKGGDMKAPTPIVAP